MLSSDREFLFEKLNDASCKECKENDAVNNLLRLRYNLISDMDDQEVMWLRMTIAGNHINLFFT